MINKKVSKKNRKEFLETLFKEFDGMFFTNGESFEISIWRGMYIKNYIEKLSGLLLAVKNSDYINKSYDIWRDVGYYEDTEDICMRFEIDKEKIKEAILKIRNDA